MIAGRDLDQRIAEKVMGWTRIDGALTPPEGFIGLRDMDGAIIPASEIRAWVASWLGRGLPPFIPAFSTDIAAAWLVQDAVRDEHDGGLLELIRNGDDTWFARFSENESVTCETAAHAICLAALKAVNALPHSPP
jgi:ABA sandwich protein